MVAEISGVIWHHVNISLLQKIIKIYHMQYNNWFQWIRPWHDITRMPSLWKFDLSIMYVWDASAQCKPQTALNTRLWDSASVILNDFISSTKMTRNHRKQKQNGRKYTFVTSTVVLDGLEPLSAKASAGTMVILYIF